jgi:hypothetical protein
MTDETTYETQRIDHLGIVAGISREIELVETIDKMVGENGRKVSCGEGTLAMIQNALGFSSRALYLMPDYMQNKPVDLLIRARGGCRGGGCGGRGGELSGRRALNGAERNAA